MVEDEFIIRMMLSENLQASGYKVTEARDADEALSVLALSIPDLVISDVRMPGSIDGIGLLLAIKHIYLKLPVIITSAHFKSIEAIKAGANGFVTKPYEFASMLMAVRKELTTALTPALGRLKGGCLI